MIMKQKKNSPDTLRKVLKYLRFYRVFFVLALLLAAVTVIATLYIPILVGRVIDCALEAGRVDFDTMGPLLLRIGVIAACSALSQWLMNISSNHMTYGIVARIRRDAFDHLQVLPLSYLDRHPAGEIVSRVIADTDQFAEGVLLGFNQLFSGILTIIGTLGFMLYINWKVTVVVLLVTPVSIFAAAFISGRSYSMFKRQSEIKGEQTALIDETVAQHKVITAFGQADAAVRRFDEINSRLEKASLRAIFFSSLTNPSTRFVNSLVYMGAMLCGALLCIGDSDTAFTVGSLTSFLSYANQYTKPFNEISGVMTELQNALACAARVFELIEEQPEAPDDGLGSLPVPPDGAVELSHVWFSYDKKRKLIQDFNLSVKPGQRIAIVGPTGCGKTTLINLLMRFYDADEGIIRVSGKDISTVTRRSLRSAYGMVLQETWLRAGTVRDNIRMGRPDATEEEIITAAKASHAHSFIKRLPQQYDTVITEDGGLLAEGQKQLLCIARVMLALPPMLILDEATSSIDTRTEQKIQQAFARLMEGRTSFIVAHRLSTIQGADVILVMRDGNIIEQGNHQALLEKGGFYAELYKSQFVSPDSAE